MMRKTVVILSVLLVGLLSFAFSPAFAQEFELGEPIEITIEYPSIYAGVTTSFVAIGEATTSTLFNGTNTSGGSVCGGTNCNGVTLGLQFDKNVFIESIEIEHNFNKLQGSCPAGQSSVPLNVYAGNSFSFSPGQYNAVYDERNFYNACDTVNTWHERTIDFTTHIGGLPTDFSGVARFWQLHAISANSETPRNSDIRNITITYREADLGDLGEYGRPFTSADEDTGWDFWEYDASSLPIDDNIYDHTVVATSNSQDAFVHSAFAGTVVVVEKLTGAYCSDVLSSARVLEIFFVCQVWVPSEITGEIGVSIYGIEGFGRDFSAAAVLSAWRVVIESAADPSQTLEYFVRDADLFIEVGSQIQEGCILGKSLRLTGLPGPASLVALVGLDLGNVVFPESDKGVTVMNLFDSEENAELLPNFKTTYPTNDQPCNTPPEYANCQGGTLLDKPENWTISDGASVDNPGATLGSFSYIQYNYPLNSDPNRHPQVRVHARAEVQAASLSVQFGQTTQSFTISTLDYQDYTIEGDDHQPDLAGLYNLRLQNNSEFTISVRYICISFTLDESLDPVPPPPPPTCYFTNPSFVNGTSGWTTTGGVSSGTGEIHVPSGGTFSQVVTLYPDGEDPQTYTIRVRGGIRYYVSYTPDETEVTETLDLDYDFPNDAPDEDLGSATFGQLAEANNEYTFSKTFVITTETTGEFIFFPTLISAPGDVVGMAVRDVCLFAGTGDPGDEPFPGHDEPGEPQPGPFNETCDVISPPQGNGIGHWISWHWQQSSRFFTCDLMVFLNTQYRMLQNHFRTVLWVARWFMASWDMGVDWMSAQFLPWLAGYLSNIQPGTIVEGEEQCDWWNIPCHLSKLVGGVGDLIDYLIREIIAQIAPTFDWLRDTLTQLFNWLLDALTQILDVLIFIISELVSAFIRIVLGLFFLIVEAILTLLMVARQSILELIFAWNNAEPTVLPGFTDCSVSPGNNAWCWVLWLSENTLFSGELGELIIPLFTAEMWILLVIMFAKEIKRLAFKVAELI